MMLTLEPYGFSNDFNLKNVSDRHTHSPVMTLGQ